MFSPRSTDAGAFDRTARYSQAAGVVTSGSGSVARKPRPPGKRKQARGGRRQVLTARVRLDAILHPEQDDASSTAAASTKPVVPQLALNQVQPATAAGAGVGAGAGAAVRTPAGAKSASYARAAANTYARTTAGSYHTPVQPSHPPPSAYTRRHHTPRLPPSSAMSSSRSAKTRPGIPNVTGDFSHATPEARRAMGVRLQTPARKKLEPKVLADTARRDRGATPREILVERVRREYTNQDLDSLLLELGIDCRQPTHDPTPKAAAARAKAGGGDAEDAAAGFRPVEPTESLTAPERNLQSLLPQLALEAFDDTSYDIHSNEEWGALIPVAATGFKRQHVGDHLMSPLDEAVRKAGGGATPVPPSTPSSRARPPTSGSVFVVGELKARALRPLPVRPVSGPGVAAVRAARMARATAPQGGSGKGSDSGGPLAPPYVGEWVPCAVEAYDAGQDRFTVRWLDRPDTEPRAQLPRLRICFAKESPAMFAQRVAAAFRARKVALARLQYNLYIDSMPLDGVGEPSEDQVRRITEACMSAPSLSGSIVPTALLYEVKLDWQRSMNRVLFDATRANAANELATGGGGRTHRERLAAAAEGRLEVTDPHAFGAVGLVDEGDETEAVVPAKGMVDSGAPPFAALSAAFAFNTTLTQPEIVATLTAIHAECDRIRGLPLLATDFPRSLQLEDFRTEQWKWIGSRCDRLKNDWVMQLAGLVVNGLAGVGKGWFNIYESDAQVFAFSKLHRLLRMITLVMQDALRDLVELSLQKFMKLLRQRMICVVDVQGPDKVAVDWHPGIDYSPEAEAKAAGAEAAAPSGGPRRSSVVEREAIVAAATAAASGIDTPAEKAERDTRAKRVADLLRPPPLFEVELKVPDHKLLLNKEEVYAAHAAREAWKARRRAARRAAARGETDAGEAAPGTAASDNGSEASSLAPSHISAGEEGEALEKALGAKVAAGEEDNGEAEGKQDDRASVGSDVTWGTTFTVDDSSDGEMEEAAAVTFADEATASPARRAKTDPEPPRVAPKYGYAFQYSQSGTEFGSLVQACISKMLTGVSDVKEITPLVMRRMSFTTREYVTTVSPTEPVVTTVRAEIERLAELARRPLRPYLRSFDVFIPLLNLNVEKELEKVEADMVRKLDLADLVSRIKWHRKEERRLLDLLPTHMDCGTFRVNVKNVRELLVARHTDMANGIMKVMADRSSVITNMVQAQTQEAKQRLRKRVRNIEELSDLRKFMEELQSMLPEFKRELNDAVSTRDALEDFCYRIDKDKKVDLWQALEAQEVLMQQMRTVATVLDQRQEAMAEDMLVQQSAFKDQLERLEREIIEFNNLTDLSQLENNYRRLRALEVRLAEAEHQVQLYNSREALFGMPVTPYKELLVSKRDFLPFQLLWTTAHKWTKAHERYLTTPVMQLNAEEVAKETSEARSNLSQCMRLFFRAQNKRCGAVAQQVKDSCDAFAPKVDIIASLLTKGMRDRHWQGLSQAVGFKLHPTMGACVPELIERDIANHAAELTRVARVAAREYELEESLNTMEETWKALRLDVRPYKNTGTFIIKSVGELMTLMDEHITTTQAMQFSAYKAPFEDAIDRWTKRLGLASEVLDEWVQVQKAWLYLAPIFDAEDIANQLPTEAKRFATVDMNWRRTLAAAESATDSLGFLAREKLLQKFKESMRFLNTVQKGLAEYLESKRAAFPRFYFLSDDDLLQILSQTKEVARVQDHLSKCFEGIHRVQFAHAAPMVSSLSFSNGRSRKSLFRIRTQAHLSVRGTDVSSHSHIIAMQSRQGERVPLKQQVVPGDKGVEVWMREVESSMRASVREVIRECLLVYGHAPRRKWLLEWPAMAVLTASQIQWTSNVEQAIKAGTLVDQYELQLEQLDEMVKLVRGQLSSLSAMSVGALAVIDVHARDVVDRLIKDDVRDPHAFEWIRNLRYYWREKEVFVEMVTSSRPFGHEYLGNSFRLVVTPLTEKCYITCMTALDLTLGGAPAGPAGTGKTETVKDLAKALGKQCVVFNCSEGLDYLAMGKFFKGLAFCGAWACFDEFNRIDVEVLSVVAQQIITLQAAVRSGLTTVHFEGTEVTVDKAFSVFVTMNPGYAGRTELPGNLKALFRPVAMMVPDYALIGEIMFFAYGFAESRDLARKMVSTFQLCSEQLSNQPHYDYGMRAVKSVIAAAGKLRKTYPDQPERQLLYRALQDVNVPKFLAQDLPLFKGIVSDLFPGMEAPESDDNLLHRVLRSVCQRNSLQPNPYFMAKCTQLFHTLQSRHGVMVVGPSGGGKSESLRMLGAAVTLASERKEGWRDGHFQRVNTVYVSPKAITMGQLYGAYDEATREWQDGVLAYWVRTFASARNRERKWIVCDGPVDADWIENLNTALDDNKKLCLASGQIIQLPAELNIVFEAEDLDQASPATVSRCGMVFHEPQLLGTDPMVDSWLERLPAKLPANCRPVLRALLDKYLHPCLAFVGKACTTPVPVNHCQLTAALLRLLDCDLEPYQRRSPTDEEAAADGLAVTVQGMFAFALVWSVGSVLTAADRPAFSAFLRQEMSDHGHALPFPDAGLVHDYCFNAQQRRWSSWESLCPAATPYNSGLDFGEIFVPTPETVLIGTLLKRLISRQMHVLLLGPTGTGKSVNAMRYLACDSGPKTMPITFTFSARTSAQQLQNYIEDRCEKRRRNEYGPPIGSKFVAFLDDLNLPRPEEYGAQPPLELLRQWLTYGGWYDLRSMATKRVVDTAIIAAMGNPGGGRHPITRRLYRHFNVVACAPISDASKVRLFSTTLSGFLTATGFHADIRAMAQEVTKVCVSVYNSVCKFMLPTPSKPHYTFNLRDLSKVLAGILMGDKERIGSDTHGFLRLVIHEARRVLQDRLINEADRAWFDTELGRVMEEHTGQRWSDVMTVAPEPLAGSFDGEPGNARGRVPNDILLFGDFVGSRAEDRYEEVTDIDGLVPLFEEFLTDYNLESRVPMRLVMFIAAISHVARLVRVLRQHGNALLLGVGGSGRQSSTKLATFMAEYQLVQIAVSKGYSMSEWHDDVKRVLLSCGLDDKPSVLLIVDTQIVHEAMLEDVSNLLNSGDVPGLYSPEELDQIMEASKFACQLKGLPLTKLNLYNQYITRVRRNLHVVVAMTPVGSIFRDRLRMFPALVNCSTINWYSAWPAEALQWVAECELELRSDHGGAALHTPVAGAGRGAGGESKGKEADSEGQITTAEMVPPTIRDPLVHVFNTVHQSCIRASELYLDTMRRHNYVTPACYLEFLRVFKQQLLAAHKEVDSKQQRLEMGLHKLEYTAEQVTEMRKSLVQLRPELEKTQAEVDEMMVQIHEDRVQADATRAIVAEEEGLAREKAEKTRAIADDAQRDLDAVLPLLDKAVECLNSLKRADIDEVRSMARPPLGVQLTMEAACIMFGVKPATRRNAMGQSESDYWESAKTQLLRDARGFLQRMFSYDRDHIPDKVIAAIEPYIDRPEFQPEEVDRVNKASAGVCLWVRAMFQYHQVLLAVEPKKQNLAAAQAELDKTLISLSDAKARLRRVTDHVAYLEGRYNDAVKHKESLAEEIERCTTRLDSAQKLTAGLGSESARWRETVTELIASKEHLLGDVVVAAGTIAYLGPFDGSFREDVVQTWVSELDKMGISHSPNVTIRTTLYDGPSAREWQLAGLPTDDVSTENGIIIHRSRRSPIMIDPQQQANRFIKALGERREAGIEVLKPGDKHLTRTIENAIRYGRWVLLEDVSEALEPSLVQLLACNTTTIPGASGRFLRVGDAVIPYHPSFRLFLTTSVPNPHFTPETCSNATVLNFMLTPYGLEEQLLTTVISREIPALEDRKVQLAIARAGMEAELLAAEDKILSLLNTTTEGHLLDDTDLILALARAKGTAHDIKAKIAESAETQEHIEQHRDAYRAIASRASAIFFCIYSLRGADPMYQFSLAWFKHLFDSAIVNTSRSDDQEERINTINDFFTSTLYTEVCRSLFERHKLMFAFLLAIATQKDAGKVDADEWRFVLSGQGRHRASRTGSLRSMDTAGTGADGDAGAQGLAEAAAGASTRAPGAGDMPDGSWVTRRAWEELGRLESLQVFRGLRAHIVEYHMAWRDWAEQDASNLDTGIPGHWADMTPLQLLCITRAMRPDGVVPAVQRYVADVLGEPYLSSPSFNLEESYNSSTPVSPLVFVISPGTDPFAELHTFATDTGMLRNFQTLSLGQGQGEAAKALITTGAARGHWILLMNCHLYTSWMDTLRDLVEKFRHDNVHRNFRLWLTSEPTDKFPVSVLQRSVKMTMERPTGLRANLLATFRGFHKEMFFEQPQARVYAKLLYGLAFFHASILERRRFGALGWNKVYEFSDSDMSISREQLDVFLGRYTSVPFKVLNEMAGGINYGGRITDDKDLRTVDILLRNFFNPDVLEDGYSFSASGKYVSLPYDDDQPLEGYLSAIKALPVITEPEAFGMHPNANVMVALDQAYTMFDTILSIQPSGGGGGSGGSSHYLSRVRVIAHTARKMLERLPNNFDAESVALRYPVRYEESMNVVLVQEVIRYNGLLTVMRESLEMLLRATDGEVVMSAELEELGAALFNQWIPGMWKQHAYPSLKPLGAWERELLERVEFLRRWDDEGAPAAFWLSGFFFPQAFLTGTLQNFARKYTLPIDTLSFSFKVRDDIDFDPAAGGLVAPDDGCFAYGLFLEGVRWSDTTHKLTQPEPRELYPKMPMLHLLPVADYMKPSGGVYRCPVYKTLARQGRLSTTGHSTNFIMWLELPAEGTTVLRPALVSEVGAGVSIGDQLADTRELVQGGAAAFCSLRY